MNKSTRNQAEASSNDADRHAPETEATNQDSGRDGRGRFTAGNPGGPGNPFARGVAHVRQVMMNAVSDQDIDDITATLVLMAKQGDLAAIKLVFQYVLGKPAAAVDPDRLDHQEVDLFRGYPEKGLFAEVIATRLPPRTTCDLLRGTMPAVGEMQQAMIRETAANLEQVLEDFDKEEGTDDDEDEEPEGAEPVCAGAPNHGRTAPSTNGDRDADRGRRTPTAPPNGGAGKAGHGGNGPVSPRPPAGT